jgi:hypothetical protein
VDPAPFCANLLLTLPFVALFFVQLVHHTMWRDEVNAFSLAQASPTLASLFHHIHYEGHPWLWYFLLWILAKFTISPVALKVVQACIGGASLLLLGIASPFSRVEKVLLFLGYFLSFEYTVMARSYGIILLLLLLYLPRRIRHPEQAIANALLLGLMSSTDITGIILSFGLVLEYVLYTRVRTPNRRLAPAALLYAALTGLAVLSERVARDVSWRTTGHLFEHARSGPHLIGALLRFAVIPFLPIKYPRTGFFWNPIVGDHRLFYLLCLPLVLGALYAIFRGHKNLLALLAFVILAGAALGHLIYDGVEVRHFGVTFLAFLAALWILKSGQPQRSHLPIPAYCLLGLTALAGIMAALATWRRPFSNVAPAAAWLESHHLADAPLAGTPDTTVVGLTAFLHRPIYMLDCNCSGIFLLFTNRRDGFDTAQIPARLALARQNLRTPSFLYAGILPFTPEEQSKLHAEGFDIQPLASFTGAENGDENFFLYRLSTPSPTPPPGDSQR